MAKMHLSESLKKVQGIIDWFDDQKEADVEQGLEKIKEAAALIKESRRRLKEIENEFAVVRKDLEQGE